MVCELSFGTKSGSSRSKIFQEMGQYTGIALAIASLSLFSTLLGTATKSLVSVSPSVMSELPSGWIVYANEVGCDISLS